jgi:hypothetical protein
MVGAALVAAAMSLQLSGIAAAATTAPTMLGEHCVAVHLEDNNWIRACAAVADDGTRGPFAVPLSSYGTMGVYTHGIGGDIVLAPAGTYMMFIRDVVLYVNHAVVDTVYNPLNFYFGPSYASLSGDPESAPAGYVEAEMQYELYSTAGNTGLLTVWSNPVPTSGV